MLFFAACRSVPVAEAVPTGHVDVDMVLPPANAVRMELESSQAFVFPNLLAPVVIPDYPEELLPRRLGPLRLCVEVVVGETGAVTDAKRRIDAACPDMAGPHEARFAQVLLAAVGQWRFDPALVCRTPDGRASPDACAEADAIETPVAVRLSYAVHFSQHDGAPRVEMQGAR